MTTQDDEPEIDPYMCHCGPCKQFWKVNFPEAWAQLKLPPRERAKETSLMYGVTQKKEDHPAVLKIGDRVVVKGKYKGVVKYLGLLDDHLVAPQCYVGVHLDDQVNSIHNGVYGGKRYFHCPRGHGAFVSYCDVVRINPADNRPPVSGNSMYPHYKDMLRRRKQRAKRDHDMQQWGPPFARSKTVTVFDVNDIAAKDQQNKEFQRRKSYAQRHSLKEEAGREELGRWKRMFGDDQRAEIMANTLKSLHVAYNKGRIYQSIQDESETSTLDKSSETRSHDRKNRHSSVAYGRQKLLPAMR